MVAPFTRNAGLLAAADEIAFAVHDFHKNLLKDSRVLLGRLPLEDARWHVDKFTEIFSTIPMKEVSCLHLDVPCTGGMTAAMKEAVTRSGETIPLTEIMKRRALWRQQRKNSQKIL